MKQPLPELVIGQQVYLNWNGWPGVPKWLDGDRAKVLGFTRSGRVRVQPKSATRSYTARRDQIDARPRTPKTRQRREHTNGQICVAAAGA